MPKPGRPDLEAQLTDLAAHLAWPPTPDLAATAAARLERPPGATRVAGPPRSLAKSLLVAAVIFTILAAPISAWPWARRAVADLLGLPGIHISAGTPPPVATTSPAPLDLGQPATLAEAAARIGFPVRIPTLNGFAQPDRVFVAVPPPEGEVTLMYLPRSDLPASAQTGVGLLLTEFRGVMETGFFGKIAGPGTTIEALSVHHQPAYWLSGAPHVFFYRGPRGDIYPDTLRLATNTLVWQAGPVTLRVEGEISRDRALAIANSLP